MSMKRALQIILAISVAGVMFSGTLTYRELSTSNTEGCAAAGPSGTLLGYPPCVYGLVMYGLLAVVAVAGLRSPR